MYELRSYGNRETGEAHYLVDGVEVSQDEYNRCMKEYQNDRCQNQGGSVMSKYRTFNEYREMVRNMAVQELMSLAETYNECQSLGVNDVVIKDILNEEVERRINNWQMVTV
jgi:hypothetical protein